MVRGRGTGFISLPEHEEDVIIDRSDLGKALDGDIVTISLRPKKSSKDRQEGVVQTVVKRAYRELIGTVERSGSVFLFKPDNRRIHIRPPVSNATAADLEKKVVVEIDTWPDNETDPTVQIIDTLGPVGDHETEMQAIIRGGGFAGGFSPEVQTAAETLHRERDQIFATALSDQKRRDMREVETFTIDPADAKDFDDALSYKKLSDSTFEIGIHIADVSHYVQEGDPLDVEARERATSVYLVDRVIPMLPEILSNDLCSLRPNEDRLAFSAVFTMDTAGAIHDQWYGQTVIHSDTRFTYEEAQNILDTRSGPHLEALTNLMDIGRSLRKKRYASGAIAFEQPEVRFELDERGAPIRAYVKERTETMMMIEDFMLLANQNVATYINELCEKRNQNTAFIYRIHDAPSPDRIEELALFVRALGYSFESENGIVEAKELNQLMKEVEGTPEETLIKTATIRSMAKAIYSTKNIGHFGLAFKYYTHFTSPIRRYPDLLAHRMLRKHLDGSQISAKEMARYERISAQASEREVQAVSAERDSIKFKQVEYMVNNVGKTFTAVVTGVSDWGVYVQEKNTQAEGMIRLAELGDDYFIHEKSKYRVRGEKTGTTYRLGDEVAVKLTKANVDERQLDFILA